MNRPASLARSDSQTSRFSVMPKMDEDVARAASIIVESGPVCAARPVAHARTLAQELTAQSARFVVLPEHSTAHAGSRAQSR